MEYPDNTVLIVDDETAVLTAFERLLRVLKCHVITTVSAIDALAILEKQPVDIVISDMRMPEMAGECFLEQVAEKFPNCERIVISGYTDVKATIDAINKGQVSRFISKPWEDKDVLNMVKKSFEHALLKKENVRLSAETQQKNLELQALNQSLDLKVQARTEQLKVANQSLKNSYRSVVRMFSTLTTRRLGIKASSNNQKLNLIFVSVAKKAGIEGGELKQLYFAWQLRQIGKLSFSDDLIKVPYLKLDVEQQRVFQTHPLLAQAATLMVKPLYPAGKIVSQHKEYLDGSGYPKKLKGEEISYRAQILAVVNDYVELMYGFYDERQYSTTEAINYLQTIAAERYNQSIVTILMESIQALSDTGDAINDKCIHSDQLTKGMRLTRDLISDEGIMLLSSEQVLDEVSINRIREIEFNLDESLQIYVSQ
ncbi:HD domain-containing phosphohydrolase [Neptuniibacter marinus]|uniref:HD domain-containing phosphohydrolase n=1 Tax=Neptuniibacter marinus TaxID=1806670 RepID=UPI003B5C61AC